MITAFLRQNKIRTLLIKTSKDEAKNVSFNFCKIFQKEKQIKNLILL